MKKKLLGLCAAVLTAMSACGLASCGNNSDNAETESFTYLLAKAEDSTYYSSYSENPVVKYLLSKEWNGKKLDIDFNSLVSGSESDQFQTMLSTGEYYDVMDLNYSNYSPSQLYNMDVLMDLTDLVDQYMPNYKKMFETNEDLKSVGYTTINGEKKIIQIYSVYDKAQPIFEGFGYRRDWIVKYGTNPSTGKAFTYGYTDPNDKDTYYDDVMFPSWYNETNKNWYLTNVDPTWDGTCPVFISDWEWMMDILSKAIKAQNISDGYVYSPYYPGYQATGDLFCAFGGCNPIWTKNDGTVTFNATGESMKSYLECLNTWYKNGWIDKSFNEHSSDMFYSIEPSKTHAGKIGMWVTRIGETGRQIEDSANYPLTDGIEQFGARQPINDIYGSDETKYKVPYSFYAYSTVGSPIGISSNCKNKDVASLLTFIDYLFSDEGSDLAKYGFTKEQVEELDIEFYKKWGFADGLYERTVIDGETYYKKSDAAVADGFAHNAAMANRLVGRTPNKHYDGNQGNIIGKAQKEWDFYTNTGYIDSTITALMTEDESTTYSKVINNINTYMSVNVPKFIKGEYTVAANFDDFAKTINKYGPSKVTTAYQRILDEINGK